MLGSQLIATANPGEKFTSPSWFMNKDHFQEEKERIFIQKMEDGSFKEFNLELSSKGDDFSFSMTEKKRDFVKL